VPHQRPPRSSLTHGLRVSARSIFFRWVRNRYLAVSREVKRLDATTRSPVYAHFSTTLRCVRRWGWRLAAGLGG
jgi:hypothetical protein